MQAARSEPSQATVDWVARVDFLRSSAVATDAPEVRETHMSWVVMDRETVWKLKKPVRYPFLDFSTLAAREHACREEVRLNRRLAPEIYLGVVAIVRRFDGRLELGPADGEVVDWLVKMRRLPADRALDHAIRVSTVTISQIDGLAEYLATFYRAAPAAGLGAAAYASRFAAEQLINRDVLLDARFKPELPAAAATLDAFERALGACRGLLDSRVDGARIVEGHGDLRPEHVFLLDTPVIIDCLEFNRELRLVDPFDELAFLSLECEIAGAAWVGERLVARCTELLEDRPDPQLLAFYRAYRALLRARLSAAHLFEPAPRDAGRWLPQARRYVALGARALGLPDG
jgi:uncharacterized protein